MNQIPYNWTQRVELSLKDASLLPEEDNYFSFPWNQAAESIQDALQLSSLKLKPTKQKWKKASSFLKGMGENPVIYTFEVYPLQEKIFIVLSQEDVLKLTSTAFFAENSPITLSSPELRQGFYQFLLLKVLHALDQLSCLAKTSLRMLQPESLPQDEGLCINVLSEVNETVLEARVICSRPLVNAAKEYAPLQEHFLLSEKMAPLELSLSRSIGKTALTSSALDTLEVGDFVILDECSFDPLKKQGIFVASLGKHPLFEGGVNTEQSTLTKCIFTTLEPAVPLNQPLIDSQVFFEEKVSSEDVIDIDAVDLELDLDIEDAPSQEEPLEESVPASLPIPEVLLSLECHISPLTLSLQTLLHLHHEKTLDESPTKSDVVTLVHEGKQIAQGELIKLGEMVGVRILERFSI
ncbi:hypothetical protein [Rhabdochlamydiaceae symbiont of Dictyostelium giganteum]|uniref:hypothetical protein n=1 Tax=Rhabdochlamydiaceae symbiont of Dictyostelium giganteum TaxID=3342349 RepID=UPI0038512DA5